ncbi:hypothetical protein HY493_05335 [Candidatus Woesearchaeota archaeon]|nr:hypothetical protein [Candidatus Woesearchaeota archaeon]
MADVAVPGIEVLEQWTKRIGRTEEILRRFASEQSIERPTDFSADYVRHRAFVFGTMSYIVTLLAEAVQTAAQECRDPSSAFADLLGAHKDDVSSRLEGASKNSFSVVDGHCKTITEALARDYKHHLKL